MIPDSSNEREAAAFTTAARPTRAHRYLAAMQLAIPGGDEAHAWMSLPGTVRRGCELLRALIACDCGNSIPGAVEKALEVYLDLRGVRVTSTGALWFGTPEVTP